MTVEEAVASMRGLVGAESPITDQSLQDALSVSLTWDAQGLLPGELGYTETWDLYWAIGTAFAARALQVASSPTAGDVSKVSSEGTSFEITGAGDPDWMGAANLWFRKSPMYELAQASKLGYIDVDLGGAKYNPTSREAGRWI